MVDVVNIEYIGIILVVFSSVYLCCKKMDENERNGNERNGNETVNLLPEYKLSDDPPAYE